MSYKGRLTLTADRGLVKFEAAWFRSCPSAGWCFVVNVESQAKSGGTCSITPCLTYQLWGRP
jgi:hypothetical protein